MESLPTVVDQADSQIQNHAKSLQQNQVEPSGTPPATDPGSSDVLPNRSSAIFIQDACFQHRFIRSRDTSAVVERPERLRAVKLGLAAAMAHIEDAVPSSSATNKEVPDSKPAVTESVDSQADDLAAALDRMNLATKTTPIPRSTIPVVNSSASVDILNNAAVKFIHGDVEGDVYLENLRDWTRDSQDKIMKGESEIPEGLSQGDLYLCPGSVDAIQGAIGTVCEAVDTVITATRSGSVPSTLEAGLSTANRAFVAIRPPGHHCGEDTPSGFCFVNNVAIAAAHAHLQHRINRVVVLDIDLHHGNGTQSIAWQINEEAYRQTLESEFEGDGERPAPKPGLRMYYGSIHDILSYPCEDGKMALVQAASVSLHGSHGQYIENIHLEPYTSEEHFWDVLYKGKYSGLIKKAKEFLDATGGPGDDVLVFISCGFDACEHEYPSMSRHNRKVPTSFYHHFAKDACAFADQYAQGRLVSVLEGGYSDHALISGAMAHFTGLVDVGEPVDESWWSVDSLVKLEKATKKQRGGRQSLTPQQPNEPWLERAVDIFSSLDAGSAQYMTPSSSRIMVPSPMTLRERKKPGYSAEPSPAPSPTGKGLMKNKKPERTQKISTIPVELVHSDSASSGSSSANGLSSKSVETAVAPKVRRVILHVRDPANEPPASGS